MHCRPAPALLLVLAASLWLAGLPAQAQYKWKDAAGQVHVSDLPPPRDVPDKAILQRPSVVQRAAVSATSSATVAPAVQAASAAGGAASRPNTVDPELAARRKRAEQEAQAKQAAADAQLARQRAENCQRARAQLAGLQSGQRMARMNERGERVVMDDAMREAEIATAQSVIASDCR